MSAQRHNFAYTSTSVRPYRLGATKVILGLLCLVYSLPGWTDIYQEAPGGEAFARQALGAFQKEDYSILQKLQPGPKELFSWSPISGNEILEAFMPRMGPKQRAKAQAELEQMNKERFARHDKAWAKASQDAKITDHYAGLIAKRTTEQQQAFAKVEAKHFEMYRKRKKRWVEMHIEHFRRLYCSK